MLEVDLSKPGAKSGVLKALERLKLCNEFERVKLEITQEHQGEGLKVADAREKAWPEATRRFLPREVGLKLGVFREVAADGTPVPAAEEEPPKEAPQEQVDTGEVSAEAMEGLLKKIAPVDFYDDIRWVYLNLANKGVRPDQAPNAGAWALLEHVRKYPKAFFDQLLPKALAKAPEEEEGEKREKKRIEDIEDMLIKLREAEG